MCRKPFRIDKPLIAAVLLCLAAAAPVVYLIFSSVIYQRGYREFVYQLSVSTVHATDHNTLKAEQNGDTVRVSHQNAYTIFALFTEEHPKLRRETPGDAPDLILDYGNGAVMECWEVRLEDTASRRHGVFWCFTGPDGKVWMYDTDAFNIQALLRPTALSQNGPWQ